MTYTIKCHIKTSTWSSFEFDGEVSEAMKDAVARALVGGDEAARTMMAADDLLAELRAAHQIIRNALAVMITVQKADWGERNERDGVAGEGATRANEREAVIKRAEGRS